MITHSDIRKALNNCNYSLCKGVFGAQSDFQCTGYDHLCALAILENGDSEERIAAAKAKIASDPYYKGFQDGWDCKSPPTGEKELEGWTDGFLAVKHFKWQSSRNMEIYGR